MPDRPSFTCPHCGWTSHQLKDVDEGYCGHCHKWTGVSEPEYPGEWLDWWAETVAARAPALSPEQAELVQRVFREPPAAG